MWRPQAAGATTCAAIAYLTRQGNAASDTAEGAAGDAARFSSTPEGIAATQQSTGNSAQRSHVLADAPGLLLISAANSLAPPAEINYCVEMQYTSSAQLVLPSTVIRGNVATPGSTPGGGKDGVR